MSGKERSCFQKVPDRDRAGVDTSVTSVSMLDWLSEKEKVDRAEEGEERSEGHRRWKDMGLVGIEGDRGGSWSSLSLNAMAMDRI